MDAEKVKTSTSSTSDVGNGETPNHTEPGGGEVVNSPTKGMEDMKITNGSTSDDPKSPRLSTSDQEVFLNNHTASPEPSDTATQRYSLEMLDPRASNLSPDSDSKTSRFSPEPTDFRTRHFMTDTADPKLNRYRPSRFAPEPAPGAPNTTAAVEVKKTNRFNVESGDFKASSRFASEPPSPKPVTRPGGEMDDTKKTNRRSFELGDVVVDDVLCDSCIDGKKKAVRSCLVCQTSFCDIHLKPHLEGAAFRDHKLLDPIRDFEARKCQLHSKTMELFCQSDQVCICYLCMFQEHKNHTTVTVEAEKYVKETELSEIQEQLHLQILEVGDEEEKWQKEKDRIKNYTTNQKSTVDSSFKDLIRELQRQKDEVLAGLDQKEREAIENVEHIVNELEGKREQLQMRQHAGAKLLLTTDAVLFLQEFQIVIRNTPPIPPLPTYNVVLDAEKLAQSMAVLRDDMIAVCRKHVEKVGKTDLSRNLIEKNNPDNRYMVKDYTSGWNTQPDSYNRFTSLLAGTGANRPAYQPSTPGRTLTDSSQQSLNSIYGTTSRPYADNSPASLTNMYGTQGSYNVRQWEPTPIEDTTATSPLPYQYQGMGPASTDVSKQVDSSLFSAYPMITRHQAAKPQTQTWKTSKQGLLSHQRPFYVNKGKAANPNEPQ